MASFGRITVQVKKGSELVGMNPGKTANPFVRISAGKNSFDTEVIEKTVNPLFEQGTHVFPPCPLPTILTINVFNKLIYLEEDEPMGTATVTIFSAGPETTKTVFLTHGGNVKLAAKARGGCGTLELVYTVSPADSLEETSAPPPTSSTTPSATATTTAAAMESSMPDFLKEGGGGSSSTGMKVNDDDDPFNAMFGEKKAEVVPTPTPAAPVEVSPPPLPAPTMEAMYNAAPLPPQHVSSTPPQAPIMPPTTAEPHMAAAPAPSAPISSSSNLPRAPSYETDMDRRHSIASATSGPAAQPQSTGGGSSLPSTPSVASPTNYPVGQQLPGPLGQAVHTSTPITSTAPASSTPPTVISQPPPATTSSTTASSSSVTTPTTANGDTKTFSAPPPLPVAPEPPVKQVTFDGKSMKSLAINKRRSPSASRPGDQAHTRATTTAVPATTRIPPRSSSASRTSVAARTPSATSARKPTTTSSSSSTAGNTSSLHAAHTAASSAKTHTTTTTTAANANPHHQSSTQQLHSSNPHLSYMYTGDRGKALLAAAITGSQKEFTQVKELDPLLLNGLLAVKDYSGRNALHLAAWHGNPAVLDQLLNGRNPSGVAPRVDLAAMVSVSGNNLLHCAALGGDARTVEWLLFQPSCQSLVSSPNKRGLTPYQAALEAGNTECAAAIQQVASRGGGVMGASYNL